MKKLLQCYLVSFGFIFGVFSTVQAVERWQEWKQTPLDKPIDAAHAEELKQSIQERTKELDKEAKTKGEEDPTIQIERAQIEADQAVVNKFDIKQKLDQLTITAAEAQKGFEEAKKQYTNAID